MMKLHAIARRLVTDLKQIDVLVLPVMMHPTIRVGEWAKLRAAKELEQIIRWIAPCPPFNVTGQPAISVPSGFTPDGLPLGVPSPPEGGGSWAWFAWCWRDPCHCDDQPSLLATFRACHRLCWFGTTP